MTAQLHIGCQFAFQAIGPSPSAGIAQRHLADHAALAEALGYDSLWVSEHHLAAAGAIASPFTLLAAAAARTQRLTLGTKVVVPALRPPLLLAEDAAATSILSDGRFVLGLGLGYDQAEFAALDVPRRERVPRLEAAVRLCRAAWAGEVLRLGSQEVEAVLRPVPPPIPIWLAGGVPAAATRAARLGDGFLPAAGSTRSVTDLVAALDGATEGSTPLPVATSSFVATGEDEAQRHEIRRGLLLAIGGYDDRRTPAAPGLHAASATGSADEVVHRLAPLVEAFADREHHLVVRLEYPGMEPEAVADHLRAFAQSVTPALRSLRPPARRGADRTS